MSCIRYSIGYLPRGSGFGAVLHPANVVVLKYVLLIVVRLARRHFSGSGEALGASGEVCVLSIITVLHKFHPSSWMHLDAKSLGPP